MHPDRHVINEEKPDRGAEAAALLRRLSQLGVKFHVRGDRFVCDAPRGVLSSELQREIGSRKAEILACLTQQNGGDSRGTAIRPSRRGDSAQLSFAQAGLWFLDQLEGRSHHYNLSGALSLEGPLDVAALASSIRGVVRRHEVLRTRFLAVDGKPVQQTEPDASVRLAVIDLLGLPPALRHDVLQRLATQDIQRPFDLSRPPLLRTSLLRLERDQHVLLTTVHHIVYDGISNAVLFREIAHLYTGIVTGRPAQLDELPLQYADFAAWQRDWLKGETLDSLLEYWQGLLADAPALCCLPTDRPRSGRSGFHGAQCSIELGPDLTRRLHRLSIDNKATLFMTMFAGLGALLHRSIGDEDLVIGTPVAGRDRKEIEGLIGFFVNTLPLRIHLHGNPTFRELLVRVRKLVFEAFSHQDLPFERLVEHLRPDRTLHHDPVFQILFRLDPPPPRFAMASVELSALKIATGLSKFDLEVSVREADNILTVSADYKAGLFDESTISQLLEAYSSLLRQVDANPDHRLLELLAREEPAFSQRGFDNDDRFLFEQEHAIDERTTRPAPQ